VKDTKSDSRTSLLKRQRMDGQNFQCVQAFTHTTPNVPLLSCRARALSASDARNLSAPRLGNPPISKTTLWPCVAVLLRIIGTPTIPGSFPRVPSTNPMILTCFYPLFEFLKLLNLLRSSALLWSGPVQPILSSTLVFQMLSEVYLSSDRRDY